MDRVGQGEPRGLQPPGADAGETIDELVVAGLWHDHLDRRERDPVAPAELRYAHIGQQGDEITLGRPRILRRQSPDDVGCRDRELASRRAHSVRPRWPRTRAGRPARASSQFMTVACGSSPANRALIIATADRPTEGRPR